MNGRFISVSGFMQLYPFSINNFERIAGRRHCRTRARAARRCPGGEHDLFQLEF